MNKLILTAIVAAGLSFIGTSEAAAHEETRITRTATTWEAGYRNRSHSREYYKRNGRDYDAYRHYRAQKMPRWLKRKQSFKRWYRQTPLRQYRFLTWDQLFEIYRWERSYFRYHRH